MNMLGQPIEERIGKTLCAEGLGLFVERQIRRHI